LGSAAVIAAIDAILHRAGPWALAVIFAVVAMESSAFLGLLFPGEVAALIAGAMAAAGVFAPLPAFGTVAGAAIAGDLGGYALGRYWGEALLARWMFARRQYEAHRGRLELYFHRWGNATVLAGRFIAVGRAFVPFAAGLSAMPARRFVPMAALAGIVWSGALVALGYVLGADWRAVDNWLRSLGVGVFAMFGFTIAMVLLWRWVAQRQETITAAWRRFARRHGIDLSPFIEFVGARMSPKGYLGLHFTIGLIAVAATSWLFGGIVQDIFAQDPLVHIDRLVAAAIARHRTADLDVLMVGPKLLADTWLLAGLTVGIVAVSTKAGDLSLAVTAALALGGAYALAFGLRELFSGFAPRVPPTDFVHGFQGFPDVAMTAVTAAYGAAGFAATRHLREWRRRTLGVLAAGYLVLLAGLSALYYGHSLSSIIGGFAVGAFWLAICLIGNLTYDRLPAN
jgi:membrane protein DedA with SNARE-associated domain